MTTTAVYEQILAELAEGEMDPLQREVFAILRRAYPAPASREQLVQDIYGYVPENVSTDLKDRKIRRAIQGMREKLIPIISSSGEAGYRLDVSEEAIRSMIAEWGSRRRRLRELIERAERMLILIHQAGIGAIPSQLPASKEKVQQLAFFGEAS